MVKNEKTNLEISRQPRSGQGTYIASGCVLDGEFTFAGPLTIAGTIKGKIKADDLVIIEAHGEMDGTVEADVVIIHGKLSGHVTALESLQIWSGSTVQGIVRARSVSVDEGALLTADMVISGNIVAANSNTPELGTAPVAEMPYAQTPTNLPLGTRSANPLPGSNLARKLSILDENQ